MSYLRMIQKPVMRFPDLRKSLSSNRVFNFFLSRKLTGTALGAAVGLIYLCFSMMGCSTITTRNYTVIPIDQFPAFVLPEGSEIQPQSVDSSIPDVDILNLNDEMRAVLDESVLPLKNSRARLNMLVKIIISRVRYDSEIDNGAKSATDTFETGTANCLSLSNLFVSMARYSGFKTDFQEIPVLPNWVKSGNALFFTRHIGAMVSLDAFLEPGVLIDPTDGQGVIPADKIQRYLFIPSMLDPDMPRINSRLPRTIPDYRAFAQYYNNIGAKYLAEGKGRDAYRYFIKAVKTDPMLGFTWSNLGVAYSRNGQIEAAEKAYMQALCIDRMIDGDSAMSVMGNLERLYRKTGDKKQADFYEKEVAAFRSRNPYYYYDLGETAYYNGNFKESVKHFREAIRRKDDEYLFHYALALSYLRLGDLKMAGKSIVRTELFAWNEKMKLDYDLLREQMVKEQNKFNYEGVHK
jgi:Flp pilus assembly protein TadD